MKIQISEALNSTLKKQHISTNVYQGYLGYLEKNFPQIDLDELLESCGLSKEYLQTSGRWVSTTFDERFTAEVIARTGDSEICYKIGQYALLDQFNSAIIPYMRGFIPPFLFYKLMVTLTPHFNKVFKMEIVRSARGRYTIDMIPILDGLSDEEKAAFYKNFYNIANNTRGYLTQAPVTLFGMTASEINIEKIAPNDQEPFYRFEIIHHVLVQSVRSILLPMSTAILGLLSYYSFSYFMPELNQPEILSLSLLTWGFLYSQLKIYRLKKYKIIASKSQEEVLQREKDYKILLKQEAQLVVITDLLKDLLKTTSIEAILEVFCHNLREKFFFPRVFVMLYSKASGLIELRASSGASLEQISQFSKLKLPPVIDSTDPRKLTNVFSTRKGVILKVNPLYMSSLEENSQSLINDMAVTTFVAVPIHTEARSIGILIADDPSNKRTFESDDQAILQTLASQLAISIDREYVQNDALAMRDDIIRASRRFLDQQKLDYFGYSSIVDAKLGNSIIRDFAVITIDIRDFTKIIQELKTEHLKEFILKVFSDIRTSKYKGAFVDKYLGDGALIVTQDIDCAIDFCISTIRQLKLIDLEVCAGISFGEIILMNIGTEERLESTAYGMAVNESSRYESFNKLFNSKIIVPAKFLGAKFRFRSLGEHLVRGISSKIELAEILDIYEDCELRVSYNSLFNDAIALYRTNHNAEALSIFQQIQMVNPRDGAVLYFIRLLSEAAAT